MKSLPLAGLFALSLAITASGATYSTNFSSLGSFGSDVNGQDGWTINDTTDQFSFVANWNSNKAIGLGDASVVDSLPLGSLVELSHGISATVGTTSVNFDFALIDSSSDTTFKNRDQFGISLSNGLGSVVTISFVPEVSQPVDPSDNSENSGDGAKWFVFYQAGSSPSVQLNMAIFEGASYDFMLSLTPNANPLLSDLMLTLTGDNALSDGATGLAIDPESVSDQFNIFWAKSGTNEFGSNLILMDNLTVIPEPSSILLVGLAGLGFISRRRRN